MLYLALLIMGFSCGFVFGLVTFIEGIIGSKWFSSFLDIIMMSCFAIGFFCVHFAYSDGILRFYYFVIFAFGFAVYMLLIYRTLLPVSNKISGYLNKALRKLTNRLKFSKKSIKKLLHFKH